MIRELLYAAGCESPCSGESAADDGASRYTSSVIVYLDDKRRELAQTIGKLQHAIAGIPLLMVGLGKLSKNEDLPIAAAEIALAAIVLATFIRELREVVHHRKHGKPSSHPKIGWFDLAAGALLIYEAFHGAHHKPGYLRPQFFTGVTAIALGLLHARLSAVAAKKRYLKVDDEGIQYRMKFRGWSIAWDNLASIDLTGKDAVFVETDGERHTIEFGRFHNHQALRQAIAEHPGAAKLLRG